MNAGRRSLFRGPEFIDVDRYRLIAHMQLVDLGLCSEVVELLDVLYKALRARVFFGDLNGREKL